MVNFLFLRGGGWGKEGGQGGGVGFFFHNGIFMSS